MNVGLSGHWVVDALDGEDERRQGAGGVTWNRVLLDKEGERSAQLILLFGEPGGNPVV